MTDGRVLHLAPGLRAAMRSHAERVLPIEAVGMLCGVSGHASMICELVNLGGARHFLADPRSQYEAERRAKAAGLTVVAAYHSHPDGGPQPSQLDLAFAAWSEMIQIIIALPSRRSYRDDIRAYRVLNGAIENIELVG